VGQVLHGDFAGVRIDFIGQAGVGDQRGVGEAQGALLRKEPGAAVSEAIDEAVDLYGGFHEQFVGLKEIGYARRVHVEQRDHRDRGGEIKLNVVA
jgi:hypothetical protein